MSVGANAGKNLNLYLFEVFMVSTDPLFGTEILTTVSVHPLLTVPESIQYSDNSRAALTETTGGSLVTKAGRALRTCNMSGTFGVESRGLGPYIGNGDMRFQRFMKEVVRMADALTAEDIDAAVDVINGTPFISLLVKPYIPDQTVLGINFYDFWDQLSFQCLVNFTWSHQARGGSATGLRRYTAQIREVGPIKSGSVGSLIISGLMDVLGTWGSINDLISSTTVTDILDAQAGVLAIGASAIADSVDALNAQLDSVTQLMGGSSATSLATSASLSGIASFVQNANAVVDGLTTAVSALVALFATGDIDNEAGAVDPSAVTGEGDNAHLLLFEQSSALADIIDAAGFQTSAGIYFGMSRADYGAFISSGGTSAFAGPDIAGALRHVVSVTDTPASLEAAYGTAWSDLIAANGLTPDEALLPGTELHVPILRPRGVQGINGLPTFGSHIGTSAWGTDLALEFTLDDEGNPVMVRGEDALVQGMQFLIEVFGDDILKAVQSVPEVARVSYISQRLQALFKTDRRIVGVDALTVVINPAGGYDVDVTLFALNGGTVRTGALAA